MREVPRDVVMYHGDGSPDVLVGLDLPLRGRDGWNARQAADAVRYVVARAGWRAGDLRVGLRVTDSSSVANGKWDAQRCETNANALADDHRVVGVLGGWNAGCAAVQLPVFNQAGLALVGITTTYAGLTLAADGVEPGEPERYYPSGSRSFVRVVANDAATGRGLAELAASRGGTQLFVLAGMGVESYSLPIAEAAGIHAVGCGLEVVGRRNWTPNARSYRRVMREVQRSGADALILTGLVEDGAWRVLRDIVGVLGPDAVRVYAPDGLASADLLDAGREAAEGLTIVVPGPATHALEDSSEDYVAGFAEWHDLDGDDVSDYTPLALAAAEVMLHALTVSRQRTGIRDYLFAGTEITTSALGSVRFTESGDVSPALLSVYEAQDSEWVYIDGLTVS